MSSVLIEIEGFRGDDNLPWVHAPQFWLLRGRDTAAFRGVLERLQRLARKGDWESDLDQAELWRLVRDFLLFNEQNESGRRQLAKRMMLQLGMINSMEHFKSDECGTELHAADIGALERVSERQPADHIVVLRAGCGVH